MSDTQLRHRRSTVSPRRLLTSSLGTLMVTAAAACGSGVGNSPDPIESEVFIQTYIDLRTSALDADSQRLAPGDREAILREHSVTAEELTHFANSHGSDLDFMRDVWNEVELRLDRMPAR